MNINFIDLNNGFKMIEASAGTGKTFTLSHLALKKIIEDNINPDEILIITYTRKAANELREKIIERFNLLKYFIENSEELNIDETLKNWYENIDINLKSVDTIIPRIDSVLDNPKSINILTIDSLFKKIIDEYNVEFNISPKIIIENNFDNIYESIIDQLWIKDFLSLDLNIIKSIKEKELDLGKNYGKKINKKFFKELLKNIDNNNLYEFDSYFFDKNISDISQILLDYINYNWKEFYTCWKSEGNDLYEYLISIGKNLDNESPAKKIYTTKNRKLKKNIEIIENINKDFISNKKQNELIYRITKDDDIAKYFYKGYLKKKLPNHKEFYDDKKFVKLQESIYKIKYDFFNKFINIFISKAINKLNIRKRELDIFKSSDITKTIQKKINTEKININKFKKISDLYKVVFIDEFQDTDNSQWEIIKSFFLNKDHLLITVGDPKQAIYKFRGGDIATYERAKKESNIIYTLDENYRSSKSLLSLINKFYKNGLQKSKLEYKQLLPKSLKEGYEDSLNIINFYKNDNLEEIVMVYVINLIQEFNIDINSIGILTRTNNQCEKLMNVAKKYNLQYKITRKKNIFDTEASELFEILIKYISQPNSLKTFLLFASSKLIALNIKDIDVLDKRNKIGEISKKCKDLLDDFEKEGFISFVNNLIFTFKSYELISNDDLINEIFQLAEIIEEELIKNKYNISMLKTWYLNELDPLNRKNIGDKYITKNNSNSNGININTIHSSKGLEYDIVICPYLWSKSEQKKGPLWKINNNKLIIEIDRTRKIVESIFKENTLEEIKENERLIYVALTRAKNKLVIFNNLDQKENNLINDILSELENQDKYFIDASKLNFNNNINNNFKNKNSTYSIEIDKFNIHKENKNIIKDKRVDIISSYSSWIKNSQTKFQIENKDKDYEDNFSKIEGNNLQINREQMIANPLSKFPRGTNSGTCLHKIIEEFNFQSDSDEKLEEIINRELLYFNIDNSYSKVVLEGVKRIINTPLGNNLKNIKLKDIPENNIIKEFKYNITLSIKDKIIKSEDIGKCFLFDQDYEFGKDYSARINKLDIYSKGFHTGCIDCILPVGDSIEESKWWIIDWKSNFISQNEDIESYPCNYNYETMKEEMNKHHYPLQAHLYLLALHRFLKWRLPNYSPQKSLGGFIYLFIRGLPKGDEKIISSNSIPGIFSSKVSIKRILYLDNLFKYD